MRLAASIAANGCSRAQLSDGTVSGDIADVQLTNIEFDGPILVVGGVSVMNVGLSSARERYRTQAVAAEIIPKDVDAKATLANIGQMQA